MPAARQPALKTITVTVGVTDQNADFLEHAEYLGRKVRVTIRSNAYKFQSHARLEVLDLEAMKWNVVAYIPHTAMKTPEGLCYLPEARSRALGPDRFAADRAALLDLFRQLVS